MSLCLWAALQENIEKSIDYKLRRNPGKYRGIPRTCWRPTDDEPLRYEFGASPFLNFLFISHSIKGRHNGESLFWQRIPTATSIINTILPIISAEPALFGVYADVDMRAVGFAFQINSRRFLLKVEGLARVSKHAEKTTTSSDRGV